MSPGPIPKTALPFDSSSTVIIDDIEIWDDMPTSTGPNRTTVSPIGAQPSGTTSVILSVTTDGSSDTCTYGGNDETGGTYPLDNSMTNSGTSHTATITGLSNGNSYSRNVMCTDGSEANDTDHIVSWSIANDVQQGWKYKLKNGIKATGVTFK